MTPPLFFTDSDALAGPGRVVIAGAEGRHAVDVRRLRAGEALLVGDGRGRLGTGVVVSATRGELAVDVTELHDVPAPNPRFAVAQALAKGGRDEDAVESMTEVGVDTVIGWQAARAVAKWTDRTSARWTATARAAAKQSRRAWIPAVEGPLSTVQLVERLGAAALSVVLHEDADEAVGDVALPDAGEVLLIVGPEGGVAPEELSALVAAGAQPRRLGPNVLRSSTAGVVALSVLSAMSRWR